MLYPKQNKLVFNFFSWYIKRILKKDFHNFQIQFSEPIKEESILLIANHFSWWDGFFMFYVNKKIFKKNFHVLVNTENYLSIRFLRFLGAFAPEHKSRDILNTLNYAGELLDNPNNLVLIFPQGKLHSNHVRNIVFEKGIMHIIHASKKNFNLIFSVSLIDYFSNRKPSATVYLKKWDTAPHMSLQLLKSAFNKHYEESVHKQSQIIE